MQSMIKLKPIGSQSTLKLKNSQFKSEYFRRTNKFERLKLKAQYKENSLIAKREELLKRIKNREERAQLFTVDNIMITSQRWI